VVPSPPQNAVQGILWVLRRRVHGTGLLLWVKLSRPDGVPLLSAMVP
jgi:hypothetical protein